MSMPVLNAAKEVVFVCMGEGKAEIVQRVLEVRLPLGRCPTCCLRAYFDMFGTLNVLYASSPLLLLPLFIRPCTNTTCSTLSPLEIPLSSLGIRFSLRHH